MLLGDLRGKFLTENIGFGKKVLDIGCRDGELTGYFAKGNEVLGADIDSIALKRAEEKLGIRTIHLDLNSPWECLPKNHFDVVVAAEVIEHLYYPSVVTERVKKVLKPGGLFIGTVPNAFSLKNRMRLWFLQKKGTSLEDPTHINHFTVKELKETLDKHFECVSVYGAGRLGLLANIFPQELAFNLFFYAKDPRNQV